MSFTFYETLTSIFAALACGAFVSAILSPLLFFFDSWFSVCVAVLTYDIAFMVLSYLFLDGTVRFYMFACSFVSFYFMKKIIFDNILRFFNNLVKKVILKPIFGRLKSVHTLDKKK